MSFVLPYPIGSDKEPIIVPYLVKEPYDYTNAYGYRNFPAKCGISVVNGHFDPTIPHDDLAALMQSWLYFGLIDEVLQKKVSPHLSLDIRLESRLSDEIREFKSHCLHFDWPGWMKSLVDSSYRGNRLLFRESVVPLVYAVNQNLPHPHMTWRLSRREENARDLGPYSSRQKLRIQTCLSDAEEFFSLFDNVNGAADSNLASVTLSVAILISYLRSVCNSKTFLSRHSVPIHGTNDKQSTWNVFRPLQNPQGSLTAKLLLARFQQSGRCTWRVIKEFPNLDSISLYFLSSVRSNPRLNQHNHCSSAACIWNIGRRQEINANASSGKARHRSEGCSCRAVESPIDRVTQLIQNGDIPLMSITRDTSPTCQLKLDVIKYHSSHMYTAISHLWADRNLCSVDGLNNLYECQLDHIDTSLGKLSEGYSVAATGSGMESGSSNRHLFWLDTLCIPELQTGPKKKAINMMNVVYSCAKEILILDDELQNLYPRVERIPIDRGKGRAMFLSAPALSHLLTIIAHVTLSDWAGRAWTYQESRLGQQCFVQLGNSLAILDDNILTSYANRDADTWIGRSISRIWIHELVNFVHDLFRFLKNLGLVEKLSYTWIAFYVALDHILAVVVRLFGPFPFRVFAKQIIKNQVFNNPVWLAQEHRENWGYYYVYDDLYTKVEGSLEKLHPLFRKVKSKEERFIAIWNALSGRSTTKPEDLPIIIANLIGFETKDILNIPDSSERMRRILLSFEWLPVSIMFVSGEKLRDKESHGDSWIPCAPEDTLSYSQKYLTNYVSITKDATTLEVTDDTLYQLDNLSHHQITNFNLVTIGSPNNSVQSMEVQSSFHVESLAVKATQNISPRTDDLQESQVHYLLLERTLPQNRAEALDSIKGAVFRCHSSDDTNMLLQYECAVRVTLQNAEMEKTLPTSILKRPGRRRKVSLIRGMFGRLFSLPVLI
ncbi:MAG: hypothetical protein Q9157_000736 [Trypethelium eluteriae]